MPHPLTASLAHFGLTEYDGATSRAKGDALPPDVSQVVFALGRIEPGSLNLLGTAFAVSPTKIATAYHTLRGDDRNLAIVIPRMSSLADYQDTSDARVNSLTVRMTAADPIRDLCVLEFENANVKFPYALAGADSAPPGTPVVTFGFPHANYGRMVLTQQATQVGARVLIASEGVKNKHLVLNTQAREGQSGGPVFDSSATLVVGVLIGSYAPGGGGGISLGGVDPATLHQTTHAISAEYLVGML